MHFTTSFAAASILAFQLASAVPFNLEPRANTIDIKGANALRRLGENLKLNIGKREAEAEPEPQSLLGIDLGSLGENALRCANIGILSQKEDGDCPELPLVGGGGDGGNGGNNGGNNGGIVKTTTRRMGGGNPAPTNPPSNGNGGDKYYDDDAHYYGGYKTTTEAPAYTKAPPPPEKPSYY